MVVLPYQQYTKYFIHIFNAFSQKLHYSFLKSKNKMKLEYVVTLLRSASSTLITLNFSHQRFDTSDRHRKA